MYRQKGWAYRWVEFPSFEAENDSTVVTKANKLTHHRPDTALMSILTTLEIAFKSPELRSPVNLGMLVSSSSIIPSARIPNFSIKKKEKMITICDEEHTFTFNVSTVMVFAVPPEAAEFYQ